MKGRGSTSHLPQLRPPRSSHLPQPRPTRAAAPRPCTHLAEERKPPEEEMPVAVSREGEEGAQISRRKAPGSCPMLIPNERKPPDVLRDEAEEEVVRRHGGLPLR
jgi:hypothetical protein